MQVHKVHGSVFNDDGTRSPEQPQPCSLKKESAPTTVKTTVESLSAFNNSELTSTQKGMRSSEQQPSRGNKPHPSQ
jgi:hypothetical protein